MERNKISNVTRNISKNAYEAGVMYFLVEHADGTIEKRSCFPVVAVKVDRVPDGETLRKPTKQSAITQKRKSKKKTKRKRGRPRKPDSELKRPRKRIKKEGEVVKRGRPRNIRASIVQNTSRVVENSPTLRLTRNSGNSDELDVIPKAKMPKKTIKRPRLSGTTLSESDLSFSSFLSSSSLISFSTGSSMLSNNEKNSPFTINSSTRSIDSTLNEELASPSAKNALVDQPMIIVKEEPTSSQSAEVRRCSKKLDYFVSGSSTPNSNKENEDEKKSSNNPRIDKSGENAINVVLTRNPKVQKFLTSNNPEDRQATYDFMIEAYQNKTRVEFLTILIVQMNKSADYLEKKKATGEDITEALEAHHQIFKNFLPLLQVQPF